MSEVNHRLATDATLEDVKDAITANKNAVANLASEATLSAMKTVMQSLGTDATLSAMKTVMQSLATEAGLTAIKNAIAALPNATQAAADNANAAAQAANDAVDDLMAAATCNIYTRLINSLFAYADPVAYDSIVGSSIYDYVNDEVVGSISYGQIRKYTIDPTVLAYFVTTSIFAGTAHYPLVSYFNENNEQVGYQWMNSTTGNTVANDQILTIPEGATQFWVNSRQFNATVRGVPAGLPTVREIGNRVYNKAAREIMPTEIEDKKLYNYNSNTFSTGISDANVKKFVLDEGITSYLVSTSAYAGYAGYPLISYFDEEDNQVGYEYMMPTGGTVTAIQEARLNIPADAAYFYVNWRLGDSQSCVKVLRANDEEAVDKKSISILFVGNSMTQDSVSYIPYILSCYYPEIEFKIYDWFVGGWTLGQQYEYFVGENKCESFSVAENVAGWTNLTNTRAPSMKEVLNTYKFDIVCMQEYYNYKDSSDLDQSLTDWINCQNYIATNYAGGNSLEFISLFHAPLRAYVSAKYALTTAGNEMILRNTVCQDMLPCGIAIYNALQTSIGTLGDHGDLSFDGTHTQEGLPSLIQNFEVLMWIFDRLGMPKSIYGSPIRITSTVCAAIKVPGAHGTAVVGTDDQNLIAQDVCVKSYKQGRKFVADNIYVAGGD